MKLQVRHLFASVVPQFHHFQLDWQELRDCIFLKWGKSADTRLDIFSFFPCLGFEFPLDFGPLDYQ